MGALTITLSLSLLHIVQQVHRAAISHTDEVEKFFIGSRARLPGRAGDEDVQITGRLSREPVWARSQIGLPVDLRSERLAKVRTIDIDMFAVRSGALLRPARGLKVESQVKLRARRQMD